MACMINFRIHDAFEETDKGVISKFQLHMWYMF